MSIDDVRKPFYKISLITFLLSIVLALICSYFINKFSVNINRTIENSEKRFKQAILHAPFPIMIHAEDGKVVALNNAWTILTGYTIKDIPTINDWTTKAYGTKSEDINKYIEKLYKLDKPIEEGEYAIKTKIGDTLIWDFSSAPLSVLKEEKRLVLSIAKDVTQRKKMEESLKTFNEEIQAQNEEIHSQNDEYKQINEEYKQINDELILEKEKVQEIQLRYKAAFNESPDSININKIDGTYVDINEGFTNVTGYTREDVIGIKSFEINIWAIPEDREKLINGLKEKGEVRNLESKFKCKDGSIKTALMSASLIKINNEPHILSITRDITDRKIIEIQLKEKSEEIETQNEEFKQINEELVIEKEKIKESTQLLRESQKTAKLGSYLLDFKTGIWKSSEILDEIFGIDEKYIRSVEGWGNLIHPDDKDMMLSYFANEVIGNKKTFNKEYRIINKKTCQTFWVHGIGELKFNNDGSLLFMIGTIINITEKKLTELQLKEKSEEIETQNEEYKQINEELTISKEKAEESDRLKSAFLANMSHEIRTPMNGILGFSQLLLKPNLNEIKRKEFIEIINTNGHQLLGIINDIIDISKIEAGLLKANSNEFNLNKLIDEIEQFVSPNILHKKLLLTTNKTLKDFECNVITDETKIHQILTNLVTNAIKFTDKGEIEIGYNIKNNFIELFVKDTGKGVPEEDYNTIFERFRQLDNQPKESRTGTGLGLPISKAYVEFLGGKIWVESELNNGTTFYFTIPYNKANEIIKEKNNESKNHNWQNKTILIADDEIISFMYFQEILKETNVNIIYAEDGEVAIEKFKSNTNIDLVLMDLKMPVLNGYSATKEIKKINNNVPIIAQSAYVFADEKAMAFECGCCDYISKPIDIDFLFELLNKYL